MSEPCSQDWHQVLQEVKRSELQLAGVGCFAQVIKVGESGLVVKRSIPHPVVGDLQPIEKLIYERLGHHPYILRYYGERSDENVTNISTTAGGLLNGLVFEYVPGGLLSDSIALVNYTEERTNWPTQVTEALRYIHSKNVVHGDFGCHNFLVRGNGSLALSDFGGSVIDGSMAQVGYATRYQRPCGVSEKLATATVKDDIFALGSVLYEISTGSRLFADITSRDIQQRFRGCAYPDLALVPELRIRTAILKCWNCEYETTDQVLRDIRELPYFSPREVSVLQRTTVVPVAAVLVAFALRNIED